MGGGHVVGLEFGNQLVMVDGPQELVSPIIGCGFERHGVMKDPLRFPFSQIGSLRKKRKVGGSEAE
jgi:hypothetical protein